MRASPAGPPPSPAQTAAAPLAAALERALAARVAVDLEDHRGRRAAVLIVLYDRDGRAHLLLTKRSPHLPSHPGQVSLPGGAMEPGDADLMHTALRETHEELAIEPRALRVVGRLDDVDTIATGFLIRPFVAVAAVPPSPRPADGEVARVIEARVDEVLALDAALPADAGYAAVRYPLDGEDVWGATARILRTFAGVTRAALAAGAG